MTSRSSVPAAAQTVPDASFCIRCGESLRHHDPARSGAAGRRGSYAAAPAESVARVALFSTILPHLPRADLAAFRVAFVGGLVVLLGLVAVGAFPAALVGAAVLVPALMLLYVYSIDVYEETPLPVIALTLVWGIAWGSCSGWRSTRRPGGPGLPDRIGTGIVALGVVVPLLGGAAMLAGPLILLRDRRYNDVLDGATFGVTSAVAFVGAQVIAGLARPVRRRPDAGRRAAPVGRPDPGHRRRAADRRSRGDRLGGRGLLAALPGADPRPDGPGDRRADRRSRSSWPARCWSPPRSPPTCPDRSSMSPPSSLSPR